MVNELKKSKEKTNKNLDSGHRERLRDFIVNSYSTATKEKVFEYFLCMAIPRRDTRMLAKTVLDKVGGSINSLVNKDYNYLKNTLMLSDAIIAAIFTFRKMMTFCNEEEFLDEVKLDSRIKIAKYFQREIGSKETEYIMVLFLNSAQKLIDKKIFGDNNASLTSFDVSNLVNTALNNNSKYIVLSHNHPTGDVKPTKEDKITTSIFEDALKHISKCELVDHIIVSKIKYYSFYENNLLKNVYKNNMIIYNYDNETKFDKK